KPAKELVGSELTITLNPRSRGGIIERGLCSGFETGFECLENTAFEVLGLEQNNPLPVPGWSSVGGEVLSDAVVGNARLPGIGDDRRPEEPQAPAGVDEHRRVAIREARRVRHQESLT